MMFKYAAIPNCDMTLNIRNVSSLTYATFSKREYMQSMLYFLTYVGYKTRRMKEFSGRAVWGRIPVKKCRKNLDFIHSAWKMPRIWLRPHEQHPYTFHDALAWQSGSGPRNRNLLYKKSMPVWGRPRLGRAHAHETSRTSAYWRRRRDANNWCRKTSNNTVYAKK